MYRIELSPGEETVFRTIEELAIAVRNGLVTARARIYHNASQKWLPIEFHPHYKKALELPVSRSDVPPARPTERAQPLSFATPRPSPADLAAPSSVVAPATRSEQRPVEAPADTAVVAPVAVTHGRESGNSRKAVLPEPRAYTPPDLQRAIAAPAPVTHLVTTREFRAVAAVAEEGAGEDVVPTRASGLPPVVAS